jgi:outer membrane protein TolC
LFKNGQITGTEFREAQLNLLNAEIQLYISKINAKLSEYELLRLSGTLISKQ